MYMLINIKDNNLLYNVRMSNDWYCGEIIIGYLQIIMF